MLKRAGEWRTKGGEVRSRSEGKRGGGKSDSDRQGRTDSGAGEGWSESRLSAVLHWRDEIPLWLGRLGGCSVNSGSCLSLLSMVSIRSSSGGQTKMMMMTRVEWGN